jgi:hypothetical protein
VGARATTSKANSKRIRQLPAKGGKEIESLIEWHYSEPRLRAIERIQYDKKNGLPTKTNEYWEKRPSLIEAFKKPKASDEAIEIYNFICKASIYTVDKGVGMGMDVTIAPDILKIDQLGQKMGIDIFKYEEYCQDFIAQKSEQEQKQNK